MNQSNPRTQTKAAATDSAAGMSQAILGAATTPATPDSVTIHSMGEVHPPYGRRNRPSTKKLRSHPRTFDVLEARSLVKEHGLSYAEVGRRMGVTGKTIARAVNYKQRLYVLRYQRTWGRKPCARCGREHTFRGDLCRECTVDAQVTTVRPNTLLCQHCRKWKPDDAFKPTKKEPRRRHRFWICRVCERADERKRRARKAMTLRKEKPDV